MVLPLLAGAVKFVGYTYDDSDYKQTGNVIFKIELEEYNTGDDITVKSYYDFGMLMWKETVTDFNNNSGLKNGINTCIFHNLEPGLRYYVNVVIGGKNLILSFNTLGGSTLLINPNIKLSSLNGKKVLNLQWLTNSYGSFLEIKFFISPSQGLDTGNAQIIIAIPKDSIGYKEVRDIQYTDPFIQSSTEDKLYYKVWYKTSIEKDGLWVEVQELLELKSFSLKTTGSITKTTDEIFTVFPNPCANFLNLESTISGNLDLYNMFGQKIMSGQIDQGKNYLEIDIPSGMYTIVVTNNTTTVQKIITKE